MNLVTKTRRSMTISEVQAHKVAEWERAKGFSREVFLSTGEHRGWSTYGVWINHCEPSAELYWFGEKPWEVSGKLYLPAKHNLAVDSGLHVTGQRAFIPIAGGTLTPVAGSTNDGIRYGGVDNNAAAVTAATHQFDTTGANRFITLFDSDPTYSTANKRSTSLWNITDADTTIVHRRYGLTNSSANGSNTLFSMISGYELNFNSLPYDITPEGQSNFTGS